MSGHAMAVRLGWSRGVIELRQSFTNGGDLWGHFFWPLVMLAVLFFLRDRSFQGSGLLMGTLLLPSILGMNAALGMLNMSQHLSYEREDGTLLRAKSIPNGMTGYLFGKIVSVSGGLLADLLIFLVHAMLLIEGLATGSVNSWMYVLGILALGLVASLPLGAVLGSVFTSPRSQGLITLPMLALVGISGIFYPLIALPVWLQWVAQVFPIYWLGLGMRAALLPDSAVTVEIGDSWRHLETVGVLGIWAVLGLLLAPPLLRRMARRESGAGVAERRERALRRVQG
jgi:ABC-2 type transport system permease protein